MATRSLVPRNSGEGSVGKIPKAWATGVFDNLIIKGYSISTNQGLLDTDDVEFGSGNFTNGLTINGVDVATVTGEIERILEDTTDFAFFSDAVDNNGITEKTFYETPNPNTYLSGVTVASASDMRVSFQWDGPVDNYHGSASINGIDIPLENIVELGTDTRRFEGHLDNLNLAGETQISGLANGRSVILPLQELGAGPIPTNILIDSIDNAIAKPGELLGETHLKEGDAINIYVEFDRDDIQAIKVHDYGLAKEIDYTNYTLEDLTGVYRATIPVQVSNREGSLSVAVQAVNTFGSTGVLKESSDFAHTSGARDLQQAYPNILSTDPTSYNGRTDGLREGELTTFSNNISNWVNGIDTVSYTSLSEYISINNSGEYETIKTVNYETGIYSNADNIEIYAVKKSNGATDTDRAKIKVANGPQIVNTQLDSLASSATAPHVIGETQVKDGDVVNSKIEIDGKGVDINSVFISVQNAGVADGSQTAYSSSYTKTTLPNGNFEFTIPINVYGPLGSSTRDGDQPATFIARNNFGTLSDSVTTTDTAEVHNVTIPTITINDINYPAGQQAIKASESANIENEIIDFDTVLYSSDNQLNISNTTTYETNKIAAYSSGDYNVSNDNGTNNFKISATKSSNGATRERYTIVNIANAPLTISINNLSAIKSGPTAQTDNFNLVTSQLMLSIPTLALDPNQSNQSTLTVLSSGTGKNSNSFSLSVTDQNSKGTFNWQASARNLANIETTIISSNPTYTLEGFISRTIFASPTSLGAGLAEIGTTVTNPNNITFENISEGGDAPNGGTYYTYESFADGVQLNNSYDLNNKFTVCDANGSTDTNGGYIFNLDQLNRAANTSTSNPASFVISE